jgi:hypothetical protein
MNAVDPKRTSKTLDQSLVVHVVFMVEKRNLWFQITSQIFV